MLRRSFNIALQRTRLSCARLSSSNAENSSESKENEHFLFPGIRPSQFVTKPSLTLPENYDPIPIYRVMDSDGNIIDKTQDPQLGKDVIHKCFRDMVLLNAMDKILYESQRQGRISFYMTNFGEEASHIGSACGLSPEDLVYAQYREAGVLVHRGFTIAQFIDQCYGNYDDDGKGKQMPVHYGSSALNFMTISSPLATQIPQAVGSAYVYKRQPNNNRCVVVYFGDGAASEGDTHAAMNFAATLECPVIFFCRNNGYAISTPVKEQYRGDGIASRGTGYGMAAIRVDGTDLLAVYNATKVAREYCLKNNKPIILEAMQYRLGHHSTSDDSTAYRSAQELEIWNTTEHPITKLKNYMVKQGWFNEEAENDYVKSVRKQVLAQLQQSEKKLKHEWREMFHDVYDDLPENLIKQMKEMEDHVQKYKDQYPIKNFKFSFVHDSFVITVAHTMNVKIKVLFKIACYATVAAVIFCCLADKFIENNKTSEEKVMAARKILSADFEVFGIVQGVFFRKNTEEAAKRLGVRGWCMNTKDGTVKGVIEGEVNPFNEMKHWLTNVGSSQSRIDKAVFSETKTLTDFSFPSFDIRRVPKK